MLKIGDKDFRRRGLESCGLAFLLCLLLAPGAFAQSGKGGLVVKQTATQSLTLIKPSDPLFDGMLETYFPGLSSESGYEKSIRPFLVIVRNDTTRAAVAYAITWTAHYKNGSIRRHHAVFINRQLQNRGERTYLSPGKVRLIAPMFNVTTKEYDSFHSFAQFYPANVYPAASGLTSVDAEVDGVVYAGGKFIGADKTDVLQRYVMAWFAARDEMLAVLKLTQSPTVSQATVFLPLAEMLHQQVQSGLADHQGTLWARYVRARGRSAQYLQAILRRQGVSDLEKFLRDFTRGSEERTNPSVFGRKYQELSASGKSVLAP